MQTQQSRPSEDRAQSSQQQSGAQPNSGAQFQSRPPATTHSQAAPASETLSFGTASKLDQRQSRPPEMSSSAPPAPPQKQTHPQPSVPPAQQSRPDQPQSRPPVVPSSAPLEQPQKQTHPQSVPPAQQSRPDRRQPVVPLSAPPEQPQRQIHPQSSAPSAQLNSQPILQPQSQRGPSMQANHESHARPPPTAQPNARLPQTRPTQAQAPPSIPPPQSTSQSLNSQQGGTASQRKETQPSTQLNPPPAPSYGISPFAYVAATSKVPALPKPADSLQPLPSANQYAAFTKLIDIWQKTSLTEDILDIPHAQIRVLKNPKGEIFFLYGATRISAMAAFSRLQFKGMASIFINTAGIKTLLSDPPPQEVAATHKRFEAAQVPGAPQATFPEPPLAPAKRVSVQTRTPHDADKRFLAHDVLRALGKGQMYAPEEDSVRYAKRRAVEAPAPAPATGAPVPFVAWPIQPVRSNESSAKTTPEPQAPSVPIAQVARRALTGPQVPLFMPPDTSPPPVPAPAKARIQSLPASTARANCYVLVPPAPAYVRRHQEKMRAQREQEAMQVVEPEVLKEEEEEEEEIDLKELKRQRARGMPQSRVYRAQG
ncbi:hypothetical protein DFH07DRAFT_241161 [Mycena maculata]|uniref:Uncharacterized protein n=1 Tax=Mycena maculata TaxID=230809 RepID=A0AAD7JV15_9AGAR|nr:hypothetical protein DFH07DRAFT_241161 [Mycena maculata]